MDRRLRAFGVVALASCVGCATTPTRDDQGDPNAGKPEPTAEPEDPFCPKVVHRDGGLTRVVDSRPGVPMDARTWKKMKWATGHGKALDAKQMLTNAQAVAVVLSVEKKNPALIPVPFREALAANPSDPAVRLRMAECEVRHPQTRRRGAHDAAMALLLGAPAPEASGLIALAFPTQTEASEASCAADRPACSGGAYCDFERGECVSAEDHAHAFLAPEELDIEDALTRALFREAVVQLQAPPLTASAAAGWMFLGLIKCGKLPCHVSLADKAGKPALIAKDRRDGGSVATAPAGADPKARDACLKEVGFATRGACAEDCHQRYAYLGAEAPEPQAACSDRCTKSCPQ